MNKVCLTGRITKDAELRYTPNNIANVSFTLAVDRGFKDANGNRQADFISCVAWRQQAEFLGKYVKKGYMLAVEGQLQTRSYQNQQGLTVYVTEVIIDKIENLTPKEQPAQQYQQPQYGNQQPAQQYPNTFDVDDKDLPF